MNARTALLFLAMATLGCDPDEKDPNTGDFDTAEADTDTDTDTDTDADLSLSFGLDEETTDAGTPVGYTVKLVDAEGETSPAGDYTIVSDTEDPLSYDASALTLTTAGTHTLTASTEVSGETQTATATLEVSPGALADLDLTLAAEEVVAGEALGFEVTGSDVYGNSVGPADVDLSVDSEDVILDAATATTIVAGTYTLTAQDGDLSDAETFEVIAGPPESVSLELSETDIEEGDSTDAVITILDAYGNTSDADWTLTVTGTGEATVDGDEITIDEEGEFTITVTVDGTELSDSVDITVDSHGPVLTFSSPDRGEWTSAETIDVSGSVTDAVTGVSSLQVNEEILSWDADGAFSHTVDLVHGTQFIQTIAADNDSPEPNVSDDARAVLHADTFNSQTTAIPGGIIVRLNEGEGGLDAVSEAAESLITPSDIEAMMSGTLVDDEYCYTIIWTFCVDYAVTADDVSIGGVGIEIDTAGGQIRAVVTLSNVDLDGEVYSEVTGWDDYTFSADSIVVTVLLDAYVDGSGALVVDVTDVDAVASGLSFDAGGAAGAIEAIAEFAGVDVDGLIEDSLLEGVESTVREDVPPMIEDTLGSVFVSETFAFGDNGYTLSAALHEIEVLFTGIELWMETTVIPDEALAVHAATGPDVPYAGYGTPTFAATDGGAEMAISLDFANQALRAFWAGGMLDTELTDEDLGIEMAAIALVLPGLTDLTLVTEALLPAVIVPYRDGEEDENVQLQVGDLFVQIYDGEPSEETLYMELYVSTTSPASLTTSSAGDEISMTLGDPVVVVDVVYPDASSPEAAGAEGAFELLLPVFLPEITGAFGEIPIPSFAGFSFTGVSTRMVGTAGPQGYLGLSGSLEID